MRSFDLALGVHQSLFDNRDLFRGGFRLREGVDARCAALLLDAEKVENRVEERIHKVAHNRHTAQ